MIIRNEIKNYDVNKFNKFKNEIDVINTYNSFHLKKYTIDLVPDPIIDLDPRSTKNR